MKRNFLGNKKYRIYLLSFLLFSFAGMLPSLSFADFTDVGASAGVDDSGGGRGIIFGDYDNDGDLDIYLSNHGSENNRLYRNNGDGTFTDVAASAGVNDTGDGRGVAFGDYDNDGDLDIYLANFGANRLYRNNGDGTFTDVAASAGVDDTGRGLGVTWGDYDNNSYLDIYLANEGANRLYRNNGDGTFTDVAASAGVNDSGNGAGVTFGDYDNDGNLDIYLVNSYMANRLYRNNGDGTFTDVAASAGVADTGYGVGVAFGDYDNDGDLDIYQSNHSGVDRLYRNNGDGTFTDVAASAGVDDSGVGHGVAFGDYDNDGDLDIHLVKKGDANRLYRNNGDGTFTDVADSAGVDDTGPGAGVAFGDYDNDGDLDIYLSNYGSENRLYRNNQNDENYLFVRALDVAGRFNRHGAEVRIFEAGTTMLIGMRLIDGSSGVYSQSTYDAHFGLPAAGTYDIEVTFPGGAVVDKDINPLLGSVSPTKIPQGYVEVQQDGDVYLGIFFSIKTDKKLYVVGDAMQVTMDIENYEMINLDGIVILFLIRPPDVFPIKLARTFVPAGEQLLDELLKEIASLPDIPAGGYAWLGVLFRVGGEYVDYSIAPWFFLSGPALTSLNQLQRFAEGYAQKLSLAQALRMQPVNIKQAFALIEQQNQGSRFALGQNIPNPFNPETWIPYELGKAAHVTIQIYDMTGRLVRTLVLGYQTAGTYRKPSRGAYWDGRNDAGERVASGIYFYTLKAGDFKATRRMLIVK